MTMNLECIQYFGSSFLNFFGVVFLLHKMYKNTATTMTITRTILTIIITMRSPSEIKIK